MMETLTLTFGTTIQESFEQFHHRHPNVLHQLAELGLLAVRRGRTKIGIGQLFEVLRWERMIAGLPDGGEAFKLNNNYRSRYARLIMARYPELDGMFDTRELRTP